MIKLLIFDLDGTLADTLPAIRHGVNLTMRRFGYPELTYEQIRSMIGNGARKLIERAMPSGEAADAEYFEKVYATYCEMYAKTYTETTECYDGISEALETLCRRGYKIAVLSNKQNEFVGTLVRQLLPSGIVSAARGQTELPVKPNPAAALLIAESLGADASECAFIGDSDVDIKTARNAGMTSVCCTWGYRDRAYLESFAPDYIINSPSELTGIFI